MEEKKDLKRYKTAGIKLGRRTMRRPRNSLYKKSTNISQLKKMKIQIKKHLAKEHLFF